MFKKLIFPVAVVFSGHALLLSSAHAENKKPPYGRLKDGRAYRVDQGGYQLIDQMAELEVTVDDLKKQITALENETALKQQRIDDLIASGKTPREKKLKETDIAVTAPPRTRAPANRMPHFLLLRHVLRL